MKTLGFSPAHSTAICIAERKAALCSYTLFSPPVLVGTASLHSQQISPSIWLILRGISGPCNPTRLDAKPLSCSWCVHGMFTKDAPWKYVPTGGCFALCGGSLSCFPITELFQNSFFQPLSLMCQLQTQHFSPHAGRSSWFLPSAAL